MRSTPRTILVTAVSRARGLCRVGTMRHVRGWQRLLAGASKARSSVCTNTRIDEGRRCTTRQLQDFETWWWCGQRCLGALVAVGARARKFSKIWDILAKNE